MIPQRNQSSLGPDVLKEVRQTHPVNVACVIHAWMLGGGVEALRVCFKLQRRSRVVDFQPNSALSRMMPVVHWAMVMSSFGPTHDYHGMPVPGWSVLHERNVPCAVVDFRQLSGTSTCSGCQMNPLSSLASTGNPNSTTI